MSKQQVINSLREYFADKGKFMTVEEYKAAEDAPVRFQIVKRVLGTWTRVKNSVGDIPVKEVQKPAEKPAPKPAVTKKDG